MEDRGDVGTMVSDSMGNAKENPGRRLCNEAGEREHMWTHSFGNS